MKTTEIKVGTDYAYSHNNYGTRSKVHVLEVGVERGEGYSYLSRGSRRKVKNGVRVRYENGSEGIVPSREIREEWEPYAERQKAEQKARQESQAALRRKMAERARQAKVLDDYLAGHGVEAMTIRFYGEEVREALVAAGYEVLHTGSIGETPAVQSRIKSLRDFVAMGRVDVDTLAPVLADLSHRLPKATLGEAQHDSHDLAAFGG